MQNDKLISYLNELVRFRQKEIVQMEHSKCDKKLLVGYADRTDRILKTIQEIHMTKDTQPSESSEVSVKNEAASKELEELKEKYKVAVQTCADFENYKKRMQRQQADIINKANKDILEDLLKVIDDFDRVQESMKTYESNPVIEGIKLVYNNLLKVLADEGCEKIQCKTGDVFDVNFHEAVASLPHEPGQVNGGTIAQVMQSGWLLNGNLLRAAKVIVRL